MDKPALSEHDPLHEKKTHTHIRDIVPGVLDKLCKGEPVTDATDCVMTGISAIDRKLGGLRKGDLVTIAGRPSTGKTAIASRIVAGASAQAATPVTTTVFSLEEAADFFTTRILSAMSGIGLWDNGADELTNADRSCLHHATGRLSRAPLVIDDTPGISLQELGKRCRQITFDTKRGDMPSLGLVLIDYVQLLRSGEEQWNPVDEVSRVAVGLKRLAENLDVPVIVLSQLSRKVEERVDRRPILSDLNPTLADESDVVLLLSHDATNNRCSSPLRKAMEITVSKHPDAPTGCIKL